ncbi:MAG: hypothetical protein HY922_05840 [Elusimicrobia bacterium]|nr:hypothetical protein [Elusimicrobiota bacterium]
MKGPASLALLLFLSVPAAGSSISQEADKLLRGGIDSVYRMQFDEADALFQKAADLSGGHPHAYLGRVGSLMTRYIYGTEQSDPSLLERFYVLAEEAGRSSEAWLKNNPGDTDAMVSLGASFGLAARVMTQRRSWIKAYLNGRKAIKYTRAALTHDPAQGDAWLGIGMYDYYTDTYPRFIGVLAKIVLRGSRKRGIKELYQAVKAGRYTDTAAKLILVEIFTEDDFGARDPKEAARLMAEIRAMYPESAMLHAAELVALYEQGRYPQALEGVDAYLLSVREGKYEALQEAKGRLMRGTALWALGRRREALEEFKAGAEIRYKDAPTRWAVYSRIRAGQLLDLMGDHKAAHEQYRLAAAEPDTWGLRRRAQDGLARPWKDAHPGPMSPF